MKTTRWILLGALALGLAGSANAAGKSPTLGAGGKQIAFIHPTSANGVLVELYQSG